MTLHCDLRFAATGADLGQPEILIGFIPPIATTQALARLIGPFSLGRVMLLKLWIAAGTAAAVATVPNLMLSERSVNRLLVLALFGVLYLVLATLMGAPTMATLRARMSRRG